MESNFMRACFKDLMDKFADELHQRQQAFDTLYQSTSETFNQTQTDTGARSKNGNASVPPVFQNMGATGTSQTSKEGKSPTPGKDIPPSQPKSGPIPQGRNNPPPQQGNGGATLPPNPSREDIMVNEALLRSFMDQKRRESTTPLPPQHEVEGIYNIDEDNLPMSSRESQATSEAHKACRFMYQKDTLWSPFVVKHEMQIKHLLPLLRECTKKTILFLRVDPGAPLPERLNPDIASSSTRHSNYIMFKRQLGEYLEPASQQAFRLHAFQSRTQETHESALQYVEEMVRLFHLAFPREEFRDYAILYQATMRGLANNRLRELLTYSDIQFPGVSLEEFLRIVRLKIHQMEVAKSRNDLSSRDYQGIHALEVERGHQHRQWPEGANAVEDETCWFCGKKGHFARDCRRRKSSPSPHRGVRFKPQVEEVSEAKTDTEDEVAALRRRKKTGRSPSKGSKHGRRRVYALYEESESDDDDESDHDEPPPGQVHVLDDDPIDDDPLQEEPSLTFLGARRPPQPWR